MTTMRSLGFKAPSLGASVALLNSAESGDAYDAEVNDPLEENQRIYPALQTVPKGRWSAAEF
jgi:hypothetical protein